jgi:glycerophosphoryl diester phosphodiesterase
MRAFFSDSPPLAIAHRGSRLLWPENTFHAFQGAVDMGYRYLETDLHVTSDGVLVAFHDDTLERTTDAAGPIQERTWDEIAHLDAGYNFAPQHGYPRRGRGDRIPRLDDLLATYPAIRLVLDLKQAGTAHPLARLLQERDDEDRVIVGSFSEKRLKAFRTASGRRVATSSGPRETMRIWLASRFGRGAPMTHADALQLPEDFAFVDLPDERLVETAHAHGLQVHVWTVNDGGQMDRLLDRGVDGIITDRADVLKELLIRRESWQPG